MGVNHLKNIFFEILKNFGLPKPKKMLPKKQHFQQQMLQQKQHFQQMLIDPQKSFFYKNNVLVYVVSPMKRILHTASRKKVMGN